MRNRQLLTSRRLLVFLYGTVERLLKNKRSFPPECCQVKMCLPFKNVLGKRVALTAMRVPSFPNPIFFKFEYFDFLENPNSVKC